MSQASIFIVDDHPLVRHGMHQLIDGEPELRVCGEAASVHETLMLLTETRPDLAIIDLSLPDGNGLELIKHLLARFPELSILVSSMHDESMFAERALKLGAKGYICKSATGDEVINAVRQILNGKKYISEHLSEQLAKNNAITPTSAELSPVNLLSNRELEVFELIGRGLGTGEIASNLNLSIKTIESHRANIKKKLGLGNAGELTRRAIQWSLESNHLEVLE
ncbi:MAG: response regulator transcription factor [Gammaproteobacteria bacterium]|nr:response regulator transcription factor [Gammaproteobacteria bacterium]